MVISVQNSNAIKCYLFIAIILAHFAHFAFKLFIWAPTPTHPSPTIPSQMKHLPTRLLKLCLGLFLTVPKI